MINHKIVKIKRSKNYSDRFIIYFENKSVLRVSEDAFVLKAMKVGDLLSDSDLYSKLSANAYRRAQKYDINEIYY